MTTPPTVLSTNSDIEKIESEIVERLKIIGLTPNAARIAIFLIIHGPMTASDISRAIKIQRTETYNYLKTLASEGCIETIVRADGNFYRALSMDEIIETVRKKQEQAIKRLENLKPEIATLQKKVVMNQNPVKEYEADGIIYVIATRPSIINRARIMIKKAESSIEVVATKRVLHTLYVDSVVDDILKNATPHTIKSVLKSASAEMKSGLIESPMLRIKEIENEPPISFIMIDRRIALIIYDNFSSITATYTTNITLVNLMAYLFDRL